MDLGWVLLFVLIDTSSIVLPTPSLLEVCRKKLGKIKDRLSNIPAFNRSFGTLLLYMDMGREPESVVLMLISQGS